MKVNSPNNKKKNINHEFSVITYLFFFLFLAMIVYFAAFQFGLKEKYVNSIYNPLQDLNAKNVVRGEILASDGEVLAYTDVDENGNETRIYPYDRMFSHVVGYAVNGKGGLESQLNFKLLSSHSFFMDQLAKDLSKEKSIGDNVITTLDVRLQKAAYEALGNCDGAVIVMEPKTGRILAMVSKPDFNPNTIAADWENVTEDGSTVLFNRATQGQYTPGSVFKIFTTLEYYKENPLTYEQYTFDCNSSYTFEDNTLHCAGHAAHGNEDLIASFANSCNSSYANLALSLNQDKFQETCEDLLFGQKLPLAFESNTSKVKLDTLDTSFAVMQTGIGQGSTLVSPLHMVLLAGAIDNDGVLMQPYLVETVETTKGVSVSKTKPKKYRTLFSRDETQFLQECMEAVVEEGTASRLNNASYKAYGKTGTAQVSDTTNQINSWFVGFAKQDGYEDIAIAVVMEGYGSGSSYAVPVTKQIFDAYFQ